MSPLLGIVRIDSLFLELFKRHKEEHSIRSSESKSQLKVVSSKRSSVIDTGHPSGWVSRVSDSEALATTGKDWRSEAYAKPSASFFEECVLTSATLIGSPLRSGNLTAIGMYDSVRCKPNLFDSFSVRYYPV